MLYIPKIDKYLKILTDEEQEDFVVINFREYFKSIKENLYSKLNKKQNLRKVAKSLYTSIKTPDGVQSNSSDNCIPLYNVKVLNLFDLELQLKDTEYAIKTKIKELLENFKKIKVQTVIVLGYKKRNDCKIFHSCTKLTAIHSDIDEAFKSMDQSVMTKIKNYVCKDWIVLDAVIMQRFLSVSIRRENGDNK